MDYQKKNINILSQYDFLKTLKDIENEEVLKDFTKKRFFNSIENANKESESDKIKSKG
ncbi:hypothetical protein Marpi_0706 [Marinitoga piezophila KA3]|uniref:Uncharacterized protein n=1 Tax=Marinitoga piezophila (strain DSM 14283 / JCM 11233 / KA3) TaxID=443254 RepID=H2J6F8_MARPK|nr:MULTISPECIES: hypothetical protein [Marinitoga]AEX85143.1 hypothetical protein Marpi_0706 [Marinitoga piezophila KA3]